LSSFSGGGNLEKEYTLHVKGVANLEKNTAQEIGPFKRDQRKADAYPREKERCIESSQRKALKVQDEKKDCGIQQGRGEENGTFFSSDKRWAGGGGNFKKGAQTVKAPW